MCRRLVGPTKTTGNTRIALCRARSGAGGAFWRESTKSGIVPGRERNIECTALYGPAVGDMAPIGPLVLVAAFNAR